MKKIIIVFLTALFIVGGCSFFQQIEKDEAALTAVKIAAKRIGYAVAKNNPRHTAEIIAYAELLANMGDSEKLVKEALPLALAALDKFVADPIVQSDIKDVAAMIKLNIPDVEIAVKSKLARAALEGFIEGCKLAQELSGERQ